MSGQLTAFERALLGQLEVLAKGSEASLEASRSTSLQLQALSRLLTAKTENLEKRIAVLEQRERALSEALSAQTKLIEQWQRHSATLVQQLNVLLRERPE